MSCVKDAPLRNFACLVAERWLDRVPGVGLSSEIPGEQAAIHCMSEFADTWRVAVNGWS